MTEGALSVNDSVVSGGEELSERYQKLFREYSRIKAQHSVLKKAILKEQNQNVALSAENRSKEQELRKILQQLDTLNFHNQRLTKRVEDLQRNGSPKLAGQWLLRASAKKELEKQRITLEATTLDLQGKIEENENLHKEVYEIHSLYTEQLNAYQKKVDDLEQERNLLNEELSKCQMVNENSALALKSQKKDAELEIRKIKEDLNKTRDSLTGLRENIAHKSKVQAEEMVTVKKMITTLGQYDLLYQQLFAHDPKSGYKAIFSQCTDLWKNLINAAQLVQIPRDLQNLLNLEAPSFEEYLINEQLPVRTGNSIHVFYTPENITIAVQSVLSIYDRLLKVACENLQNATIPYRRHGEFERFSLRRISESFSEFVEEFLIKGTNDKERADLISELIAVQVGVKAYIQTGKPNENPHYALLKALNESSDQLNGVVQGVLLADFNEQVEVEKRKFSSHNHDSTWDLCKGMDDSFKECLSLHYILVSRLAVLQREAAQLINTNLDLHHQHELLNQESLSQKDKALLLESEVNNLKAIIAEHESPDSSEQATKPEEQVGRVAVEASTQTTEVLYEAAPQPSESQSTEETTSHEVEKSSVLSTEAAQNEVELKGETRTPSPLEQSQLEDLTEEKTSNGSLPLPSDHLNPDQMSREDLIKRHYEGKLAQLLERSQQADGQALRMRKVCQSLVQKLEASEVEKKTILKQLDEAKRQISRVQDELRTTEENYKAQLDMMTEHIAQLSANVENSPPPVN